MLTPKQRATHARVKSTLGDEMAKRYEDWCDLANDSIRLRVPGPMLGHSAREFESMLRTALKTPFEVGIALPEADQEKLRTLFSHLRGVGLEIPPFARERRAAAGKS